jgi:hypothetical protein
VPNLTVVGMVLSVARSPSQWAVLGALAALVPIVWAIRFGGLIAVGCVVAASGVAWVARRWDAVDERVQGALVLFASLAWTAGAVWMDGLWSPAAGSLAIAQTAVTYAAFLVVRRLPGVRQRFVG